jgi:DNA repair photolyase
MGHVQYVEIRAKSALNRAKGMPFKWSLNPYAGCAHACRYLIYSTAGGRLRLVAT